MNPNRRGFLQAVGVAAGAVAASALVPKKCTACGAALAEDLTCAYCRTGHFKPQPAGYKVSAHDAKDRHPVLMTSCDTTTTYNPWTSEFRPYEACESDVDDLGT
jgi:hypothetical protein